MPAENCSSSNEFIPASAVREIKQEFEAIIDDQAKRIRKMQTSLDKVSFEFFFVFFCFFLFFLEKEWKGTE